MFLRIVYESFRRQRRSKALAAVAIALGVAVTTAMIAVATDVGDKINRELRTYGANLVVYPDTDTLDVEKGGVSLKPAGAGAFLKESDLPKIRGMFWRNNIVGFAPMLPVSAAVSGRRVQVLGTYFNKELHYGQEVFGTGVRAVFPSWRVEGAWPDDEEREALVGERLAAQLGGTPGDSLSVGGQTLRISGLLSTGGAEDDQIVVPLGVAQQIAGRPGAVRRVYVSALTKPEDELAHRDPKSMSPETFDRWYCSPYAASIAYQLQEAIPHSHAEPIRQVAQNEGAVLKRIQGLMLLLAVAAVAAAALAVSATMATAVVERRREVGLMKALGASNATVAALFFAEAALLAAAGGIAGYALGNLLAAQMGEWIFQSRMAPQPLLLPIVLGLAALVGCAGSAASIRKALRFDPVLALRGDA